MTTTNSNCLYNPNPTRVWSRVQSSCTYQDGTTDTIYIPVLNKTITFANAAKYGNLDNMIFLFENGCPWDCETFEEAALHGNLDNMKWLKENGVLLIIVHLIKH